MTDIKDDLADLANRFSKFGEVGPMETCRSALARIEELEAQSVVKPLEWDWIGTKHAFGTGAGHSYEILLVPDSPSLTVNRPPDPKKRWRGKHLGYLKGEFQGHLWYGTAEEAMAARQEEHDALILSALEIGNIR